MTVAVALLAAAVAGVATMLVTTRFLVHAPLRRPNYRGILVPTGLGVAPLAGVLAAAAVLAFVAEIAPRATLAGAWVLPLAAAGGFAVLGLFDDVASVAGASAERGIRGHAAALASGRLTTGGLKMLAGGALAFALAAPATDGFLFALAGALVIALSANLLNALDLRPGRAGKAFLAGAVPLAVVAGPLRAIVCAAAGSMIAFLPHDLRERAMLGDAGANAFGAFLGACAVLLSTKSVLVIVLLALATLQIVAEGPTLSRAIAAIPPLRALDRLGRVREDG